jgi:chemotaxis protein histidine kinase CheA
VNVIDSDMIKRAEKAVEELASQYSGWAADDIVKLRGFLAEAEGDATTLDARLHDIHRIAHDMRGQGSTFGFPLVTRIAGLLCTYLKMPDEGDIAVNMTRAHIDALAKVIERKVTDDVSADAVEILNTLKSETDKLSA